jgi:hypothetical protein
MVLKLTNGFCRLAVLIFSGIIVAGAGLFARVTHEGNIEHWLVFAAGMSNLVVIFDIGPELRNRGYNRFARFLLIGELIFFSSILGVDINLAFGEYELFRLFVTLMVIILSIVFITITDKPRAHLGFLTSAIILPLPLYIVPYLITRLSPQSQDPLWPLFADRFYAWIHLLGIPTVYLITDSTLSRKHPKWRNFLFLDRSLFLAGSACATSGFLYALFGSPPPPQPLFESGAAALILLVGNSWYLSLMEKNNVK